MDARVRTFDHDHVAIPASRLPPPVISYVSGRLWRLEQAYSYRDGAHIITVPAGFEFDLSSIPRLLWWLIAPFELSVVAPLIHDFLYRYAGAPAGAIEPPKRYDRGEADDLFRDLMVAEGIAPWRRTLGYLAVRAFGWIVWGR
jgi:hypothetical protein